MSGTLSLYCTDVVSHYQRFVLTLCLDISVSEYCRVSLYIRGGVSDLSVHCVFSEPLALTRVPAGHH